MSELFQDRIEYDLSLPKSRDLPFFILAHPHPLYGGSMHHKVIDQVYRRSLERGWGALRLNFRGVGKSVGTFDRGVGELEDFLTMAKFASENADHLSPHWVFFGYSFGAWVVFKALDPSPVPLEKAMLVAPALTWFDFHSSSPEAVNKTPLHVFAAENDELIPIEKTKGWFSNLREPKTLNIMPGADHYFIGKTSALIQKIFSTFKFY